MYPGPALVFVKSESHDDKDKLPAPPLAKDLGRKVISQKKTQKKPTTKKT